MDSRIIALLCLQVVLYTTAIPVTNEPITQVEDINGEPQVPDSGSLPSNGDDFNHDSTFIPVPVPGEAENTNDIKQVGDVFSQVNTPKVQPTASDDFNEKPLGFLN